MDQTPQLKPLSYSPRQEDERLVSGKGQFADDLPHDEFLVGYVVRSPYPHAVIRQIDTEDALQSSGVTNIFTAEDLLADGVGGLPCVSSFTGPDGAPLFKPPRPVLATDRVRHVGEPVAFVVADSLANAIEAAESIEIDFEELPSNSDVEKAFTGATQIWDEAKNNLCYDFVRGDEQQVEELFAESNHVSSIKVHHPRMAITPIEPRSAAAQF
ncbi:MAG: xanthine dehydrogenase family protein, partial [Gammaproteobacteria bacterium]|nr:xanthine dehydrogenase family protein [Gammaproteobacteria bacterium]